MLSEGSTMAKDLSRKEQRELGILPRQIFVTLFALKREGVLQEGMNAKEIAVMIACEKMASDEYASSWNQVQQGTYGIDWNAIADFIERIVELLLKILPLFI